MSKIEKVTGFIRARDVREQLKSENISPKISHILEALAEQAAQQEKQIAAQASMLDRVIDSMAGVMQVASRMKEEVDRMRGEREVAEPDQGAVTQ